MSDTEQAIKALEIEGAEWLQISTIGPIARRSATVDVLIQPEKGGLFTRPLNTAPLAKLDGLLFRLDGYVSSAPLQNYGQPWDIRPYTFDKLTAPGFTLYVTRMAVWRPDAPLRPERLWYPGARVADAIAQLGPATPEDYRRAADVQAALIRFSERIGQRGKHKGDGAIWAGGVPDFLDALWDRLEELTAQTRRPYDHDPASREFLAGMRGHPAARTMRTWLRKAGLCPDDIKSGRVTRTNYQQFVARQAVHAGDEEVRG